MNEIVFFIRFFEVFNVSWLHHLFSTKYAWSCPECKLSVDKAEPVQSTIVQKFLWKWFGIMQCQISTFSECFFPWFRVECNVIDKVGWLSSQMVQRSDWQLCEPPHDYSIRDIVHFAPICKKWVLVWIINAYGCLGYNYVDKVESIKKKNMRKNRIEVVCPST